MTALGLRLVAKTRTNAVIQGRMKLAHLMKLPESALEGLIKRMRSSPLFKRLSSAGILVCAEFPAARFAARRFAGYGLRLSGGGLPELRDGNCDLARLMRSVGRERFEKWFLGENAFTDQERGRGCGIPVSAARKLREFMDRAFIRGEFETAAPSPGKVFSTVAGLEIADGEPTIAFFHRDIWKKRFRVDRERLAKYLQGLPSAEAGKVRNLLRRLEIVEQRKTTLYRLLEEVAKIHAEYLRTGEPGRRRPLLQRGMAKTLGVDPSVLCRLISNKSVQLPWGLEAPLAVLFPSAKDINRERVGALAGADPGWTDDDLRRELERGHGVRLSRRSIAQYRRELGMGGSGRRA